MTKEGGLRDVCIGTGRQQELPDVDAAAGFTVLECAERIKYSSESMALSAVDINGVNVSPF